MFVYLSGLGSAKSRQTMGAMLGLMAKILMPGTDAEYLSWHALRYPHCHALRSMLAARYAPATCNLAMAALRGVFRECWRLGLMTEEQRARSSDLKTIRGERLPRGRALPPIETRALFAGASPRDTALLGILYGCGLRRAEAVALDLEDIDLTQKTVRVLGKGNKERRVPMPANTARALERWLAVRGHAPGALFWSDSSRRLGRRLSANGLHGIVRRLAQRACIASLSPHDLRRTFVTDLLDAGADITTVQRLAGHADLRTTSRYDRRGDAALAKAVELLDIPA